MEMYALWKPMTSSWKLGALLILVSGVFPICIAQTRYGEHVRNRLLVQRTEVAAPGAVAKALASAGALVEKELPEINVSILRVPEAVASRIAGNLGRSGLFTFVEPDFIAHSSQTVVPDDPDFSSQWHLTKISGPTGWAMTTGVPSVPIAVIDSGVDLSHPDLVPKIIPGWNFLTGTSNTQDDLGHGTAVAGTAAAATNNLTGVAGVSWGNPIMPLVVLNSSDFAYYSDIANAINYAANHGVRVINISIGGSSSSSTLQSAVNYAWSKGAVIFAAAMNNSSNTPNYPAACQNVIAVSATDENDNLASFSNYGSWISLSAPGTYIMTTQMPSTYGYWQGTSFASPIAAATAALVLSLQPSLSASALVTLLEHNTDVLPAGSTGWNQYFGYGRVNVYKAILAATTGSTTPPAVSITSPVSGATVSGAIAITGTATDNAGVSSIQFLVDGHQVASANSSPFSFSWNSANVANGSHALTVQAYDPSNNMGSASVTVNVINQTPPPDTTPPTVTITQPGNGSTVRGNVQIAVSATDVDSPVAQVSIYVDGRLLCTDISTPYTCNWNTRKWASGTHTISANAWDPAGNKGSAVPVTVTK
jgi:subtilisin family serine protease